MICLITTLILSYSAHGQISSDYSLDPVEEAHIKKYSKSYTKIVPITHGKIYLKNEFLGEPAVAPNYLEAVLVL